MSSMCKKVLKEALFLEELSDVVIKVRDRDFKSHKILLCNSSPFFCDIFNNKPEVNVLYFPHVSSNVMGLVVEFFYSQSVQVTESTVQSLLETAELFKIKSIAQACCDFLQQKLSINNCISILTLAGHYVYADLWKKASLFILRHFQDVADFCPEFYTLPEEQLESFIENNELNVREERVVFEAVLRWINHAPEERRRVFPTLMSKVRLQQILDKYSVETVWPEKMIRRNAHFVAMVTTTMRVLRNSNLVRPLPGPRQPAEVLLAFGGSNINLLANVIQLYNIRSNCWRVVCDKSICLPEFSKCVYTDGFIYCIGGLVGYTCLSSVIKFSIASQIWEEAGSMHEVRAQPTAVALNGFVYALGGWIEGQTLNSAERFEPSTNQWNFISPMEHRRADAGATTLNGKVYVFGGFILDEAQSSAECYNPETNQWTLIPHMEVARGAMGAIAYKDQIFVMGGYSNGMCLSNVDVYDPALMAWRTAAHMKSCCCSFGVALLEDQLYVVGGFNSDEIHLSAVWRYDVENTTWNVVGDLAVPHGAISCCVVERTPYGAAFHL
uniref:BTB domain-containing protein n=1 Tax=Oryzias latipes TaxID=8090 RepID=A0A3P9JNQ4_ORYLA